MQTLDLCIVIDGWKFSNLEKKTDSQADLVNVSNGRGKRLCCKCGHVLRWIRRTNINTKLEFIRTEGNFYIQCGFLSQLKDMVQCIASIWR